MADDVSVRELRNQTSAVLRRVESGARVRVTVDRRPVAQIVPLGRPEWVSGAKMWAALAEHRADTALRQELAGAFPETTDEL
jgi:prevent-host-death family protein